MLLSITGFFSIIGVSSVLVLLLCILLNQTAIIQRTGVIVFFVLALLITMRLLIPFEFGFERPINIPYLLPDIWLFYNESTCMIFGKEIFSRYLILAVWAIGSFARLIYVVRDYMSFKKQVLESSTPCNEVIKNLSNEIISKYRRPMKFKILENENLRTPIIFGLFNPVILIPKISVSTNDWKYVLLHEISHFYHGDLWIKLCGEAICILYWWNPLVYILRTQVSKILEIQNDFRVTRYLTKIDRFEYLSSILKISKAVVPYKQAQSHYAIAFLGFGNSNLKQRFCLVSETVNSRFSNNRLQPILISCIFIVLFISYSAVLEPYFECPDKDTFALTKKNAYIVKNTNKFDVYYNNEFFITVEDPKTLLVKLPIYKSLSEVKKL